MYVRIWAFALSAYQMLFKIGSKIGARIEVLMPVRAIATPPIASCTGLTLAQALVPRPWLEAPIARPAAKWL